MADELAAFIEYLRVERQLSPHTRSNYQAHLEAMTAELVKLGVDDWARLEASQVRSLVTRMHKAGLAPRSLATKVSALRSFCDWQVRQGRLVANPARGIVTPSRRPLPKNLDVDEMYQLLNITDEQDPLAVRDRAIMELMYSSGLRLAELVGLNLADVKLDERQLRVTGKGSRERVLPVGRMAVEWLHKWLKLRPCWPATSWRRCSSPSASSGCRPARCRSGSTAGATSRRSTPTSIPTSCATALPPTCWSPPAICGRCRSCWVTPISTTQIYTHLDFQHLAKVYDSAHPRAKRDPAAPDDE